MRQGQGVSTFRIEVVKRADAFAAERGEWFRWRGTKWLIIKQWISDRQEKCTKLLAF